MYTDYDRFIKFFVKSGYALQGTDVLTNYEGSKIRLTVTRHGTTIAQYNFDDNLALVSREALNG